MSLCHRCKFLYSCNCFPYNLHRWFDNSFRKIQSDSGTCKNLHIDCKLHHFDRDLWMETNELMPLIMEIPTKKNNYYLYTYLKRIHQYRFDSVCPQNHPNKDKCSRQRHLSTCHHLSMGMKRNRPYLLYNLDLRSLLHTNIDMSRVYFCRWPHCGMVMTAHIH